MDVCKMLAFFSAAVSAAMDLKSRKVRNQWIVFSWMTGIIWHLFGDTGKGLLFFLSGAAFPLICLFWLSFLGMLGAGDVKVFSCLGGILGGAAIWKCMVVSFLIGGIFSIAILMICGNFFQRIHYFIQYISKWPGFREDLSYRRDGDRQENFHFTIPILMSVMLYAGGVF